MVERFPFRETEHAQRKTEREEEKWKEPVHRFRIERAEIQERRKRQHAREREVVFVFGMEVKLERGNGERENENVRVGSTREHVEEYPDDREIRKHRSGVRPDGAEFAELADSGKAVEYGDGFQKHDGESGFHRVESEDADGERENANVRIRQKEQVSEASLPGVRVSAEKNHGRHRQERKRDVSDEQRVDRAVGKQTVRQLDAVDRRKHERVRTEYLRRDVVLRSKDGKDGESDYRKSEGKPSVEGFERNPQGRGQRIRDSVERQVEKQEPEVVGSGFEEFHGMFLRLGGHFRGAYGRRFFLFLKIERSESEKKHRSENEEDDGLGKAAEEIEDGREDEVYEKKQDVHPLEVNSERRSEGERDGCEKSERRPRPRLFEGECQKGNDG